MEKLKYLFFLLLAILFATGIIFFIREWISRNYSASISFDRQKVIMAASVLTMGVGLVQSFDLEAQTTGGGCSYTIYGTEYPCTKYGVVLLGP